MSSSSSQAVEDLLAGVKQWPLWLHMAWAEVRRRYRRTVLGPFWATFSMAIFIFGFGLIGASLWGMELGEYLPYLCTGYLAWLLFSSLILESCTVLTAAEGVLKNLQLPYSVLIYAMVLRNLITFGHHIVVYLVIVVLFGVAINPNTLLVFPGLVLLAVNSFWIAMLLGLICTRYRDIQQLVTSLLNILFFLTPVMWPPEHLHGIQRLGLVSINPIFHFVDAIRSPLLGRAPDPETWFVLCGLTVVGWGAALLIFGRYRRYVAYWL